MFYYYMLGESTDQISYFSDINSFVLSRFDYCNALIYGLPDHLINRLQMVQNSAARLVVGARRWEHVTPILKSLFWLPVSCRVELKLLSLAYRCVYGTATSYLANLIRPYRSSYTATRSSSSSAITLLCLRPRLKSYGDRVFSRAAHQILTNRYPCSNYCLCSFRSRVIRCLRDRVFPWLIVLVLCQLSRVTKSAFDYDI